jgi:hypothetical protein
VPTRRTILSALFSNGSASHSQREERELLLIWGVTVTRRQAQCPSDRTLCDLGETGTGYLCAKSERGEFQFGSTLAFEYCAESGFELPELKRVARTKKLFRVGSLARQQ